MYDLANFIPFKSNGHKVTNGNHPALAWSKKDGYYFTEYGFCVGVKLIAIHKVFK